MSPAAGDRSAPGPRVVWLTTSPRLPGLLTRTAWELLAAGPVRCGRPDHPQFAAVRAAGIRVGVSVPGPRRAAALRALARRHGLAVWLAADDPAETALLDDLRRAQPAPELVTGSADPPGARLLDAVAVMDRLRSPGGCPWDAEQSHESLVPYLLEEAYEVAQAVDDGEVGPPLREELGDVLLQVLFHARIAAERRPGPDAFDVDDVAAGLVDKLVRRHPHVFAGGTAADAAAVESRWASLKAAEKGRRSVLDGVPAAQPPLAQAQALLRRAGRAGVAPPAPTGDGLGAALLALVARAVTEGRDADAELRRAVGELREGIRRTETATGRVTPSRRGRAEERGPRR